MADPTRKSRKHRGIAILCLLLMLIINISCDNKEIYYRFHELKNAEWKQNDTLFFDIDSTLFEVNKPYNVGIDVTNNVNYPYRNIWFFIQHNITTDSIPVKFSEESVLADEFGRWEGSGFGTLYQTSLPTERLIFPKRCNYRVKIVHGMRDEPLIGIEKIGLRISSDE